jgi:hypothetical protein
MDSLILQIIITLGLFFAILFGIMGMSILSYILLALSFILLIVMVTDKSEVMEVL